LLAEGQDIKLVEDQLYSGAEAMCVRTFCWAVATWLASRKFIASSCMKSWKAGRSFALGYVRQNRCVLARTVPLNQLADLLDGGIALKLVKKGFDLVMHKLALLKTLAELESARQHTCSTGITRR
jgi:hypothetical protein